MITPSSGISPNRGAIPPNPTSPENMLNLVRSRYNYSYNSYAQLRRKVANWYDLYRGYFRMKFDRWRNDVHLPLVFSTIQSDIARKLNTTFGQWPYVEHHGYGLEDAAIARKNDILISAQLKDCRAYQKAYDFLASADIYGTGICISSWLHETEMLRRREQVAMPLSRKMVERVRTESVTTFDGPWIEVIDILDAFPQPGVHDIEEMDWFIVRMWLDLDDIRALEKDGTFDSGSSKKIELGHYMQSIRQEMDERFTYRRSPYNEEAQAPLKEDYSRPVEIWEMWGTVPSEFIPADGGTQRVVTVANGQVILRNQPTPYWHGRIPIDSYCPMRDPHYFFGAGKAEVAEKMQLAANKLACQKLDALDLFVNPMFAVNRQMMVDKRRLRAKPGAIFEFEGPVKDAFEALRPDMGGVQNAYQEVNDLWRWIQQSTGIIEDTVMGGSNSKRQTRAEFMGRQENISIRLLCESRMAEEMWLEPTVRKFRALNRQFLEVPKELRILGSNAIVNPVTGDPIPPEQSAVEMEDLYRDYDVRARGTTQIASKGERQQTLLALFQSLGSHPAGMGLINWMAFYRQIFLAFDMANVNELLMPPVGQNQLMAAGQEAGGGGGVPSSAAPSGGPQLGPGPPGMDMGGLAGAMGGIGGPAA